MLLDRLVEGGRMDSEYDDATVKLRKANALMRKENSLMKPTKFALATGCVALALLLTGCIMVSVYPFYTEKDLAFEPALLGNWRKPEEPEEQWKFDKSPPTAYRVTAFDTKSTNLMEGRVFKLNNPTFIDLFSTEKIPDTVPSLIPTHMVMRVYQTAPKLHMAPINYEWLESLISTNPAALRHHLVKYAENESRDFAVFTADTAELQLFLLKHIDTKEAWKNDLHLERAPAQTNAPADPGK